MASSANVAAGHAAVLPKSLPSLPARVHVADQPRPVSPSPQETRLSSNTPLSRPLRLAGTGPVSGAGWRRQTRSVPPSRPASSPAASAFAGKPVADRIRHSQLSPPHPPHGVPRRRSMSELRPQSARSPRQRAAWSTGSTTDRTPRFSYKSKYDIHLILLLRDFYLEIVADGTADGQRQAFQKAKQKPMYRTIAETSFEAYLSSNSTRGIDFRRLLRLMFPLANERDMAYMHEVCFPTQPDCFERIEANRRELIQLFQKYDADQSGSLSMTEVMAGLSELQGGGGRQPPDRVLEQTLAFSRYIDKDGDGLITLDELLDAEHLKAYKHEISRRLDGAASLSAGDASAGSSSGVPSRVSSAASAVELITLPAQSRPPDPAGRSRDLLLEQPFARLPGEFRGSDYHAWERHQSWEQFGRLSTEQPQLRRYPEINRFTGE